MLSASFLPPDLALFHHYVSLYYHHHDRLNHQPPRLLFLIITPSFSSAFFASCSELLSPSLPPFPFSFPITPFPTFKLAGNKHRGSNQGGLLNRMFSGSSSPPKDKSDSVPHSNSIDTPSTSSSLAVPAEDSTVSTKKFSPPTGFFSRKVSEDQNPGGEKKRRSSTVTKAATFFSNAKQSLTLSTQREEPSNGSPSPLQKAGTMDAALSVPQGSGNNSAGESLPTPRSSFRVGVTEDKNRKCRRTMEDTHAYLYNFLNTPSPSGPAEVNGSEPSDNLSLSPTSSDASNAVETDNGYFAIFDGHAGTFAAEWCGKKLHFVLQDIMRKNPNAPVPELLDQTFTSVDQQLDRLPLKNSGCTAVIALLRWEDRVPSTQSATGSALLATAAADATKGDSDSNSGDTPTQALPKLQEKSARQRVLYTANVGDARAVLCRNGKALRLSYDHKGSDENEGKRIANAGGLVLNNRVNGVLAVTRALGDSYLKDLVTGHPYTTETVIQPEADEFVILACDGVSFSPPVYICVLFFSDNHSSGMSAVTRKPSNSFVTSTTPKKPPGFSSTMRSRGSAPTTCPVWSFDSTPTASGMSSIDRSTR